MHINLKEAEAAYQGLLTQQLDNCQVHLFTDNTTLFWCIKKWGSRSVDLNEILKNCGFFAKVETSI